MKRGVFLLLPFQFSQRTLSLLKPIVNSKTTHRLEQEPKKFLIRFFQFPYLEIQRERSDSEAFELFPIFSDFSAVYEVRIRSDAIAFTIKIKKYAKYLKLYESVERLGCSRNKSIIIKHQTKKSDVSVHQ